VPELFEDVDVRTGRDDRGAHVVVTRRGREGHLLTLTVRLAPLLDAVDLAWHSDELPRPDGGVNAALTTRYRVRDARPELIHDHPYGVSEIVPRGRYPRKYPTGDWMTSPQWFEGVDRPFTAASLLDLPTAAGGGLLVLHDGSQAFGVADDGAVHQVLSLYDPWDEDYFVAALDVRLRLVPHGGLRHAERWRLAQEFERPALTVPAEGPGGDLPAEHAWVGLAGGGVGGAAIVAAYREDERAGARHEGYVGRGMGHPTVVRLVEFDGAPTVVDLEVAGTVATAFRTDLLGERGVILDAEAAAGGTRVRIELAPHEIATVYLDVVEARKVARDLDAKREVWAQVHRRDEAGVTG
jgi:alpha-mannosidase